MFRRRVPKRAERFFRSRFLSLPLQTHLLREGRRMAAHATRFTDAAFTLVVACRGSMLDAQEIERVVVELLRFELEAREAARAVAPARGPAEIQAALGIEAATRQTLVAALAHNDCAAVAEPVNATLTRLGVALPEDSPDRRMIARRAAIGLVAVCEENARREQGVYGDGAQLLAQALVPATPVAAPLPAFDVVRATAPSMAPAAPILWAAAASTSAAPAAAMAAPSAEPRAAHAPTASPVPVQPMAQTSAAATAEATTRGRRPHTPVKSAGRTPGFAYRQPPEAAVGAPHGLVPLDQTILDFADWKENEKPGWMNGMGCRVSSMRTVIREIFGAPATIEATEEFWIEFFDIYARQPKDHHKDGLTTFEGIEKADRELEALEAEIEKLKASGASRGDIDTAIANAREANRRVKVGTLYAYQQLAQQVMRWAEDNGRATANTMRRVIWPTKKVEALKEAEKDVPRLPWGDKAKALFSSTIFTSKLDDQGDPLFWLPLMAYLMGLRMEEAAQLTTRDFETVDGVLCVRVQKGERQHLKNRSARRLIPVPDALLAIGIGKLVELRRSEGQLWLFPTMERSKDRDRLSGPFSKVFTAYRKEVGLYDEQRDFHSLRADFNVRLKRAGVILEIRKKTMGHRMDDVTEEHYDVEGSGVDKFRAAVNARIFDISGIRRPFGDDGEQAPRGPKLRLVV